MKPKRNASSLRIRPNWLRQESSQPKRTVGSPCLASLGRPSSDCKEAKAGSGRQTELRARIIQDMQDRIEASADIVANGEKLLSSVRSGGRAHADTHE